MAGLIPAANTGEIMKKIPLLFVVWLLASAAAAEAQTSPPPDYLAQSLSQRLMAEIDNSLKWQQRALELEGQMKSLQQQLEAAHQAAGTAAQAAARGTPADQSTVTAPPSADAQTITAPAASN